MAIINKVSLSYVDICSNTILSNPINVNEDGITMNYVYKKIEKLKTLNMCNVDVVKNNKLFDKDSFLKKVLFEFCRVTKNHIFENNFYLLVVKLTDDFANDISVAIKLDLELSESIVNIKNELKISSSLMIPSSSSSIKEAIIVDHTNNNIYVIEKKIDIDGKKQFYISPHIVGSNNSYSTYKYVFNTYLKTIKHINDIYKLHSKVELIGKFFDYVEKCKVDERFITIENTANYIFDDFDTKESFINLMQDLLYEKESQIPTILLTKDLSEVNINTGNVKLKVPCNLINNDNDVLVRNDSIVIKNTEHCQVN